MPTTTYYSTEDTPAERLYVVGLAEARLVVQNLELLEGIFPCHKRRALKDRNTVRPGNSGPNTRAERAVAVIPTLSSTAVVR